MRTTDSALLRRFFSAALVLLVLVGLAALFLFCGDGALALLGTAQLAGQPDAVSRALQSSPAELQALGWQPEDLELSMEDTIAELRALWQARGLHLRLDSPDSGEVHTVLCDAFWLGEALGDILKNCIEQTPAGGKILCRVEYDPARTRILVQDPGSFLPENTDIFARYATTRAGGVGIGLYLARQIAAAHFGTMTARNLPDGCEFCLTLPVLQGGAPYRDGVTAVTEL